MKIVLGVRKQKESKKKESGYRILSRHQHVFRCFGDRRRITKLTVSARTDENGRVHPCFNCKHVSIVIHFCQTFAQSGLHSSYAPLVLRPFLASRRKFPHKSYRYQIMRTQVWHPCGQSYDGIEALPETTQ